jgi:hypothetical protein
LWGRTAVGVSESRKQYRHTHGSCCSLPRSTEPPGSTSCGGELLSVYQNPGNNIGTRTGRVVRYRALLSRQAAGLAGKNCCRCIRIRETTSAHAGSCCLFRGLHMLRALLRTSYVESKRSGCCRCMRIRETIQRGSWRYNPFRRIRKNLLRSHTVISRFRWFHFTLLEN